MHYTGIKYIGRIYEDDEGTWKVLDVKGDNAVVEYMDEGLWFGGYQKGDQRTISVYEVAELSE